jgi:hypothetical protein
MLIESLKKRAAESTGGATSISSTGDHVREQGHGGELNVCNRWKNPGKVERQEGKCKDLGNEAQIGREARNAATTIHHHNLFFTSWSFSTPPLLQNSL